MSEETKRKARETDGKAEEIARAMERLTKEQQEYAAAHLLGVVQGMILSGTTRDEKKTA